MYFSEMNYAIGTRGPKFSPAVSKELKMTNYQEVRVKLTNTHSSKLKSAAKKKKKRRKLRIKNKNFEDEVISHELFLTTR